MKRTLFFILILLSNISSWACTSFIISGKATPTGRPMMFKHRDTDELNNRIAYFKGEKYDFIGLMNSPTIDGEVWSGMNEVGFCIMNTASYNLRNDSLDCKMDREGELMYHALSNCATISDFESWLNSYPQPWGVEANFGIIDAHGGAAYYEMNNQVWIKYDVNESANGYRVVANFSFAGRYEDYEGWERYLTASDIMEEVFNPNIQMTAFDALNYFSRPYRHKVLGVSYNADNAPEFIADQDFIPRRITSAVVVFDGVKAGENPEYSVMWTALGYPACAVAIPLMMHKNSLPEYMLAKNANANEGNALHSEMCDVAMQIKMDWIFPLQISNGRRYVNIKNVLVGAEGKLPILECTNIVEKQIANDFMPIYTNWLNGALDKKEFYQLYDKVASSWMEVYYRTFASYLQK